MFKKSRIVFGIFFLYLIIFLLPPFTVLKIKSTFSTITTPSLSLTQEIAQNFKDFLYYKENARELKNLKEQLGVFRAKALQNQELGLENQRLSKILDLKPTVSIDIHDLIHARVIGKSMELGDKALYIDKGSDAGLKVNRLVLSESSLIGKVVEVYPDSAKVLLINDPDCHIGVLIQRTRQSGILYGTVMGECRIKYLSVDTPILESDIVETAGFGNYFPKAIPIGKIKKAWKEPGQIYQVASLWPFVDFSRLEEVMCLRQGQASD